MHGGRSVVGLLAVVVAASLWPGVSSAELRDDASRVLYGWARRGVRVGHVGTLFLHEGQTRDVGLPKPGAADGRCQTVLGLAERHIRFSLRAVPADGSSLQPEALRIGPPRGGSASPQADRLGATSRAGVASLRACGDERSKLERVRFGMQSSAGAVELLVARHDGPLPPFEMVAPERALGMIAVGPALGRARRQEPLARRADRTDRAARLDGAGVVVRVPTRAGDRGAGALGLNLPTGCHRLAVLAAAADDSQPDRVLDVDAEVRERGASTALRQDRSHAPDARLEFCVGEPTQVELRYLGAGPNARVMLVDAVWPLPSAARVAGDAAGRAAIAWALFRRHVPAPTDSPILRVRGGPGATVLPLELEAGACYLAAMALTRGRAGAAALSATVGGRTVRDQSTDPPQGATVTFCSHSERWARLQVELRAGFGWWLLGVWRLSGGLP